MLIPSKYQMTDEVVSLLQKIEANKEVIDSHDIPVEIENNIRRKSTLKSALYSVRIEGSDLTLEELAKSSENQKKAEVMNILKAFNFLLEREKKDVRESEILKLHSICMKGLMGASDLGKYRSNMEAIFNEAGIAIYMPPPPRQVKGLMDKLIKYGNSEKEKFVPIRAALAHFSFEKIHPFLDGSGRVGRLFMQKILMQGGYGMKGLLSLEEYIDNHRSEYYRMLEEPEKEVTDYLVFMLTAIAETSEEAKKLVLEKKKLDPTDFLLPRRAEIYNIIRDHKLVNFDIIRRRFGKVNERTLRYDLKKLQDKELIVKVGTTKGVYYRPSLPYNELHGEN